MTRVTTGRRTCVSTGGNATIPLGTWVSKGEWDGSTNLFPASSVKKGYVYFNTANSTTLLMPDGGIIPEGVLIVAKIDDPGQTVTNWYFLLSVT